MPPKRAAAVDAAKKMTAKAPTHLGVTKTVTGRVKKTKAPTKPAAATTKATKATRAEPKKSQKGKQSATGAAATIGTKRKAAEHDAPAPKRARTTKAKTVIETTETQDEEGPARKKARTTKPTATQTAKEKRSATGAAATIGTKRKAAEHDAPAPKRARTTKAKTVIETTETQDEEGPTRKKARTTKPTATQTAKEKRSAPKRARTTKAKTVIETTETQDEEGPARKKARTTKPTAAQEAKEKRSATGAAATKGTKRKAAEHEAPAPKKARTTKTKGRDLPATKSKVPSNGVNLTAKPTKTTVADDESSDQSSDSSESGLSELSSTPQIDDMPVAGQNSTKMAKEPAATTTTSTTSASDENLSPAPMTKGTKRKATEPTTTAAPAAVKKARVLQPTKPKTIINHAPTTKLLVYVFGEGSAGELGLGAGRNAIDVSRPRFNHLLSDESVGVVQLAVGGMHCAALTYDNKIYTWGVNDQGALGRDTKWEGGLRDIDDDQSDGSDTGINPREAVPAPIPTEYFPENTVFTEVVCGDSCTFAITDEGNVWGWGTFRSNEGILGFTEQHYIQLKPILIPELKQIKTIAMGSNHAMALTAKGKLYVWGCGQQNQLGRRVVERTRIGGLKPRELGVSRRPIKHVGCGAYHSFAVDDANHVWAWGLNTFGETGVATGAGEPAAVVSVPTRVSSLENCGVVSIRGGSHHSVAVTQDGDCLVWGRVDGFQTGLALASLPEDALIRDESGRARVLVVPTKIPGTKASVAMAASDSSLLITPAGQAYSWGFSGSYQTGQGTDQDVELATRIDCKSIRDKALNWGALGGQFGVLTAPIAVAVASSAEADAPAS